MNSKDMNVVKRRNEVAKRHEQRRAVLHRLRAALEELMELKGIKGISWQDIEQSGALDMATVAQLEAAIAQPDTFLRNAAAGSRKLLFKAVATSRHDSSNSSISIRSSSDADGCQSASSSGGRSGRCEELHQGSRLCCKRTAVLLANRNDTQ